MSDVEAIRSVLRALADVRDGPFYQLWVDLTYAVRSPRPESGFRLWRIADSVDVSATLWVSARTSVGADVGWGISVDTAAEVLVIAASISVTSDSGDHEVYSLEERTPSAAVAAAMILDFANRVCGQRQWMDGDTAGLS